MQTSIWRLVGGLEGDGLLLAHGGDDGNADLLARLESGLDVGTDLALGDLDVVLGGTVREHQVEETLQPRGRQVCQPEFRTLFIGPRNQAKLTSSMLIKVYSVLETLGTSMLWVEGEISSNFLPVKI